jgi:hypothetical protein
MRKKLSSVTQMLSRYVPQLYAFTSHAIVADPACKEKLEKLFDVWEKHKYFDDNCHKVSSRRDREGECRVCSNSARRRFCSRTRALRNWRNGNV